MHFGDLANDPDLPRLELAGVRRTRTEHLAGSVESKMEEPDNSWLRDPFPVERDSGFGNSPGNMAGDVWQENRFETQCPWTEAESVRGA